VESNAVGTMRSINTAEKFYAKTYTDRGYACNLDALLVGPAPAKASADHAGFLDNTVSDANARRYRFTVSCAAGNTANAAQAYRSAAVPLDKGGRAFCSDETAVIRSSADGKAETCFKSGKQL
jgi:hypothetical protein